MSTGELKYRVSAFISILVLKISSLILTELGHSADPISGSHQHRLNRYYFEDCDEDYFVEPVETTDPDGVDYGWVMQTTFVLTIIIGAPVVTVLSLGATLPTWGTRVGFAIRVGAVIWILTALSVFGYARWSDTNTDTNGVDTESVNTPSASSEKSTSDVSSRTHVDSHTNTNTNTNSNSDADVDMDPDPNPDPSIDIDSHSNTETGTSQTTQQNSDTTTTAEETS